MRRLCLVLGMFGGVVLAAREGGAQPAASPGAPKTEPAAPAAPGPTPPVAPPADSAQPPPPPSGEPPPGYYVEPQGSGEPPSAPPATAPPAPPPGQIILEPPPPPVVVYEPPPPPEPKNRVPRTAFWAGVRLAYVAPFGDLWIDGFDDGTAFYYRRRSFSDYAGPGPAFEVNLGARLARRYNVFALWEHASLAAGRLDDQAFGGQNRGASNYYGAGMRFSTDPGAVGLLLELALGYRDFHAHWADGTELDLTDGWLDARIGVGADIRLNRWFALSPMIMLAGGSFGRAVWSGTGGRRNALTSLDERAEYGFIGLQIGAHADVF